MSALPLCHSYFGTHHSLSAHAHPQNNIELLRDATSPSVTSTHFLQSPLFPHHPQNDIERLRAVYEPFLSAFPLCYGYWKKYADAEHRHGNVEVAVAVYDRGVTATPRSMDLWGHYAAYRRANAAGNPDDIRRCVL